MRMLSQMAAKMEGDSAKVQQGVDKVQHELGRNS
jgi:hypothetical protein